MYIKDLEKRTGISSACFYPMPIEDAFDIICRKLNYKACELFLNTKSETEAGFLKDMKSKADDNGIKIIAVHPFLSGYEHFMFFTEYERRIYDNIKLYGMFFEAAQFLGADFVIFHGIGPRELRMPVGEYAGIFMRINEEAKKYGVELLHENIGAINDHVKELLQIAPEIRFAFDLKHTVAWGLDVCDMIDIIGKNIAHVHLNDMYLPDLRENISNISKTEMCRLPFAGSLDLMKIFEKLAGINYIGSFITEVYRYNYADYSEIAESRSKIQAALEFF